MLSATLTPSLFHLLMVKLRVWHASIRPKGHVGQHTHKHCAYLCTSSVAVETQCKRSAPPTHTDTRNCTNGHTQTRT